MNPEQTLAKIEEAGVLFEGGRNSDAAEAAMAALQALEQLEPLDHVALARTCELLGDIYADDLDCSEAERFYGRAAAAAMTAGRPKAALRMRLEHAIELQHIDLYDDALETFEVDIPRAIELLPQSEEWREVIAVARHSQGLALEGLGRCDEAASAFLAAAYSRLDGPEGEQARHAASISLRLAADSRAQTGDFFDAQVLAREAVALGRAGGADLGPHLLTLARILEACNLDEEAAAVALEAVDAFDQELMPCVDDYVMACLVASRLHDELGDGTTALELASSAVELCETAKLIDLWDVGAAHEARAEALMTLDCAAEAGDAWRQAIHWAREYAKWDGTPDAKREVARRIGKLAQLELVHVGLAEAAPLYAEQREILEEVVAEAPEARAELARSIAEYGHACAAVGAAEDGAAAIAEAMAIDVDREPLVELWRGIPIDCRRDLHRHLPDDLRFVLKP